MRITTPASLVLASLPVATAQTPLPAHPASLSSLSSKFGPFYSSILFAPGVQNYDYVTAIGYNADTTTWKAYKSSDLEKADGGITPWAYQNFTVGPTTYMATNTYTEYTIASASGYDRIRHASSMTGSCVFSSVPAKSPLPDFTWATAENKDVSRANKNNWPTLDALCTHTGFITSEGREFALSTTVWDADRVWKMVMVMGEEMGKTAVTNTAVTSTAEESVQTRRGTGTERTKETSTAEAGATEVTAWVNAVVVVVAAAVAAI